jgi:hypothetical protein
MILGEKKSQNSRRYNNLMETTQTFKTFTLDFAYETETFAEALADLREFYPYAVINPTGEIENGWPVIECIVPDNYARSFIMDACGGDMTQVDAYMED